MADTALNLLTQYDPNLPKLQANAESTANTASQYQSAAHLLPQQLQQAIQEKLDYNKDIISQQNTAMANYFAAPATAREKYSDIIDPTAREALVSQATANAYAPYATLSQILQQREGNVSDIINAGTSAFNAATTAETNKANIASTDYSNALNLAEWLYGVKNPTVGTAGYSQAQYQAAQTDAAKGMTFDDMLKKYGSQLDPNSIYQIYNQYNYGQAQPIESTLPGVTPPSLFAAGQGGYGALNKTPEELSNLGITGAPIKTTQPKPKVNATGQLEGYTLSNGKYVAIPQQGILDKIQNKNRPVLKGLDGQNYAYNSTSDPDYLADLEQGYTPAGWTQ